MVDLPSVAARVERVLRLGRLIDSFESEKIRVKGARYIYIYI